MRDFSDSELRAGVVLLLELVYAGETHRFTTGATVDVTSADGALRFDAGLSLDLEDSADVFSASGSTRSVSVGDLWLPVDVAALVAGGHDLAGARAWLSFWAPGRSYEQRSRYLAGRVYAPTYGGESEPVSFSIVEREYDDGALLIDATARIDAQTWPAADSAANGKAYPLVVGKPGIFAEYDGSAGQTLGSPAYPVDVAGKRFLIAGHRVQATTIRLINTTKGEARNEAIEHVADGLGRIVATCVVSGTGLSVVEGDSYFARWDDGNAAQDTDGGSLELAGDVLRFLLRRSNLPVDFGRLEAVRAYLNRYKLAFYADDPDVSVFDWIADNLLPILPISLVPGADGLRPLLYRFRATDAVDTLEAGAYAQRIGAVEYDTVQPIQRVVVRFAPRADTGEHFRRVVVSGDANEVGASSTLPLRKSVARYVAPGEGLQTHAIETDCVYDTQTAQLIAQTLAATRALTRRIVRYSCDARRHGGIEVGDVLTLTDAELSVTNAVAVVVSATFAGASVEIECVLIED